MRIVIVGIKISFSVGFNYLPVQQLISHSPIRRHLISNFNFPLIKCFNFRLKMVWHCGKETCGTVLDETIDWPTCGLCKKMFHHETCCTVKVISWKTMGPDRRQQWRCSNECRKKRSDSVDDGDVAVDVDKSSINERLVKIEKKLDADLASVRQAQDALSGEVRQMMTSFNKLMEENKLLAEENGKLHQRFDKMEEELNRTKQELSTLKKDHDHTKQELASLRRDQDLTKHEVVSLRNDHEESGQYSRKRNVIIEGLPLVQNEDTTKLALQVISGIGISLKKTDIEACHRLPVNKSNPQEKPIIVKMFDRKAAEACVFHGRKARPTLASLKLVANSTDPVYFKEHLTPFTKKLLFQARQMVHDQLVQFAWQRSGIVYVRHTKDTSRIRVRNPRHLSQVRAGFEKGRTVQSRGNDCSPPSAPAIASQHELGAQSANASAIESS